MKTPARVSLVGPRPPLAYLLERALTLAGAGWTELLEAADSTSSIVNQSRTPRTVIADTQLPCEEERASENSLSG